MTQISSDLTTEIFAQESGDPFLMLVTLSHASFGDLYYVNNSEDITSRSIVYTAFPMKITPSSDDGESVREVQIEFDNVSLELIDEIRTVTDFINVKVEMILASKPDLVEIELGELKIKNIDYNKFPMKARMVMDDFLNTEIPSEKYTPTNFPGLFT